MKNGGRLLLTICALSLVLLAGFFIGRISGADLIQLSADRDLSPAEQSETEQDYRLDINSATKVQLMDLPGIGELTAERIIEYRTRNGGFTTTDELMNVEGIGEKKLLQMEHLIKVGG